MPAGGKPILTSRHKLLGNLVPLAVMSGVGGLGVALMTRPSAAVAGWFLLLVAPVLGWLTVNLFGLWANRQLRAEIELRLRIQRPRARAPKYFVGFARPSYHSVLDPHEDVGFLIFHEDRLEFFGGEFHLNLYVDDFLSVRRRANPHTLLGLGGWVSVEGTSEGKPVRMLLEPREHSSLVGNQRWASFLVSEIKKWSTAPPSTRGQTHGIPATSQESPSVSTLLRQGTRLL